MPVDIDKYAAGTKFSSAAKMNFHKIFADKESARVLLLQASQRTGDGAADTATEFTSFEAAMDFCNEMLHAIEELWPERVKALEDAS